MSSRSSETLDKVNEKPLIELLPCGSLTDVSSFIYRESNLDEYGRKLVSSANDDSLPRSLYPPESWPSGTDLAKESDVYPAPTPQDKSERTSMTVTSSLTCPATQTTTIEPKNEATWYDELFVLSQCIDQREIIKKPVTPKTVVESGKFENKEVEDQQLNDSFVLLKDAIDLPVPNELYSKLCFPENLIINYVIDSKLIDQKTLINYKNLQEIGGLTINVEPCYNNNFLVFLSTQFSYNMENYASCKTSLLTILDSNFVTIEEKKTEQLIMVDKVHEKKLHVVRKQNESVYKLFMNEIDDEQSKKRKCSLNVNNEKKNFLLDGGCLVLMRYLVLINFVGKIHFNSLQINGTLNVIEIKKKIEKYYRIHSKTFFLVKIKHITVNSNAKPILTTYYFLKSTLNIVFIKWPNLNIQITINKLKLKFDDAQQYNIDNDLQLLSQYIDNKSKNKLLINDYLHTNYNVKNLIKDYILCLLQLKPNNILEFTIDYFINLCQT